MCIFAWGERDVSINARSLAGASHTNRRKKLG